MVHFILGPEAGGHQHILFIQVNARPNSTDIEDYAEGRIAHSLDSHPGAELLSRRTRQRPDGASVCGAVYEWAPAEGKVVFQKLVFVMHEGTTCNFSAAFSKQTMETLGAAVDGMIASLAPRPRT